MSYFATFSGLKMKKSFLFSLFVSALLLMHACAPSRFVEPLEYGENAVSVSAGGPIFQNLGYPLPIPMSSITYGRGITPKITSFTSVHVTSLIYKTPLLELGVLYNIREYNKYESPWIPGVSATGMTNFAFSFRGGEAKFWPQLDLNAYWNVFDRNDLLYVGFSNWFEIQKNRAFGEPQPQSWIFSPQIGYGYKFGKYSANLELKMVAPNVSNEDITIDYLKPFGNKGTLGLYLGVYRKF